MHQAPLFGTHFFLPAIIRNSKPNDKGTQKKTFLYLDYRKCLNNFWSFYNFIDRMISFSNYIIKVFSPGFRVDYLLLIGTFFADASVIFKTKLQS